MGRKWMGGTARENELDDFLLTLWAYDYLLLTENWSVALPLIGSNLSGKHAPLLSARPTVQITSESLGTFFMEEIERHPLPSHTGCPESELDAHWRVMTNPPHHSAHVKSFSRRHGSLVKRPMSSRNHCFEAMT